MDEESAGEFFDVLDVFDGRADVENDDDAPPKVDKKLQDRKTRATEVEDEEEWGGAQDADVDMSGDEDEDEEDEEEADSAVDEDDELRISASDSEDSSPGALADLETFLSNLDPAASHKRKPRRGCRTRSKETSTRYRSHRSWRRERVWGSRYIHAPIPSLRYPDFYTGSSTLKLDDLLAPLASSSSLAALKKSTRPLTSSSSKTKTLSAPLPQRAQERLDREAAYEQTKEEVDKWSATMKRIKEVRVTSPLTSQAERLSDLHPRQNTSVFPSKPKNRVAFPISNSQPNSL
jgi:U3 small nucleolar RNA-associated protein 14